MFARDVKNACMHVYERCNKHMHACLQEMFAMGHSSESRLNSTLVSAQILIYKIKWLIFPRYLIQDIKILLYGVL